MVETEIPGLSYRRRESAVAKTIAQPISAVELAETAPAEAQVVRAGTRRRGRNPRTWRAPLSAGGAVFVAQIGRPDDLFSLEYTYIYLYHLVESSVSLRFVDERCSVIDLV